MKEIKLSEVEELIKTTTLQQTIFSETTPMGTLKRFVRIYKNGFESYEIQVKKEGQLMTVYDFVNLTSATLFYNEVI